MKGDLIMATKMTKEQYMAFLAQGTRTGKLATVRADGRPHIAPIWFVLDGDDIVFMTAADTVKGQNLRRDPRMTLCVDKEEPNYGYVIVEGTVTLSEDLEQMLPLSTRIAARYMGADKAEAYGKRNAVAGEMLVRVTPSKVMALDDLAE